MRQQQTPEDIAHEQQCGQGVGQQGEKVGGGGLSAFQPEAVGLQPGIHREQHAEQHRIHGDHSRAVGAHGRKIRLEQAAVPASGEPGAQRGERIGHRQRGCAEHHGLAQPGRRGFHARKGLGAVDGLIHEHAHGKEGQGDDGREEEPPHKAVGALHLEQAGQLSHQLLPLHHGRLYNQRLKHSGHKQEEPEFPVRLCRRLRHRALERGEERQL